MKDLKKARLIHVMFADKFTIALIKELVKLFPNTNHHFLVLGDFELEEAIIKKYIVRVQTPLSKHFFSNTYNFFLKFLSADKIIFHGLPLIFYALIFPFSLKKSAWVIYGGADLFFHPEGKSRIKVKLDQFIRKVFIKNIRLHLTHIEGDSLLANKLYQSKASFFYHPVYLSNVMVIPETSLQKQMMLKGKLNILVGNSTDPSNHHQEIFEWLKDKVDVQIFCPLSYGPYDDYKLKVKQIGFEMFGGRFIPIENFMTLDQYKAFLNTIDIAIFNHKRQEAMGVTLSLLSLGKEVYVNNSTTSFQSFMDRGFQVFDNFLVANEFGKLGTRDVSKNADLLNHYYSREVWEKQWRTLYNLKSFEQFT